MQSYSSIFLNIAFNLILLEGFVIGDSPECYVVQLSDVFREENRSCNFLSQDFIFFDIRDDITPKKDWGLGTNQRLGAMNKLL